MIKNNFKKVYKNLMTGNMLKFIEIATFEYKAKLFFWKSNKSAIIN